MNMEWVDGFNTSVSVDDDWQVTISANRAGLISLAGQLRALAEGMPGDHIHYDEHNALEEGSSELVVERTE